ncbi:MAG: ribonuclease [Deltaproteobacteria bacterium]|nr:ribonuclease [Deltaproteobacteria bacterium]
MMSGRTKVMKRRILVHTAILLILICPLGLADACAQSCEKIVQTLNARLLPAIDEQELVGILHHLNNTGNKKLPAKFLTKQEARSRGWKPGKDLWSISGLKGMSIGGDRFGNLERRLPHRKWREADLDYQGGRRGGKRLVFSRDGERWVTIDHYQTFTEVPSCR